MNVACVIGNGPSRLQFDLHCINATMTTYGCNKLYKDFTPDYLVAMDIFIVDEIITNKAHYRSKFYTQHTNRVDDIESTGEPIYFIDQGKSTNDSGTNCVKLAILNKQDTIYMIGFDYDVDGKVPNVYGNGQPYIHVSQKFRQRLKHLVKNNSDTKFIRVNGSNTDSTINEPNYSEITVQQFKEIYDSTRN